MQPRGVHPVKRGMSLLLAAMLSAPVFAQPSQMNPVAAFLTAADNGDEPAMLALLGTTSLPEVLKGCYLRRVYRLQTDNSVIAAWMCAEGEKASRVVVADIVLDRDKVKLAGVRETRNPIPAPPRTGPALAPAPAPEAAK